MYIHYKQRRCLWVSIAASQQLPDVYTEEAVAVAEGKTAPRKQLKQGSKIGCFYNLF
jgi:hypothetical protein